MIERIRQRRAQLQQQLDAGRAQYERQEAQLKELDRQLCMIAGGMAELDALLSDAEIAVTNGAHSAASAPPPAPE